MQRKDDELYTTMFNALRHGVRRKILRILSKRKESFTSLLNELEISSSHLTYHLDSLGELIAKDESLYGLSVFGKAAVDMMKNIEDPPKSYFQDNPGEVFKYITIMLLTLFIISSGLLVNLMEIQAYQEDMLESKSAEIELLTNELEPLKRFHELDVMVVSNPDLRVSSKTTLSYSSTDDDYTASVMLIYLPEKYRVLEVELLTNLPTDFVLPFTIQKGNAFENETSVLAPDEYMYNDSVKWMSKIVWTNTDADLDEYKIMLTQGGWYTLSLSGPVVITESGNPVIQHFQYENYLWNSFENIRIWTECRLLYGRDPVSFGYISPDSVPII
ncbi:MAG: winged helix-turn-helix domain-containing protein [Candidatus Bathyarchaeota archaeon]|nr:winged helix-turn-helix domain-containing protein [Candidatus Bathyarchaeota archaeon]